MKAAFDLSPRSLAARFGQVAITRIVDGRDPYEAARLAGSYAAEVLAGTVLTFRGGRRGGKTHDDDESGAPSNTPTPQVAQPRTGDRSSLPRGRTDDF